MTIELTEQQLDEMCTCRHPRRQHASTDDVMEDLSLTPNNLGTCVATVEPDVPNLLGYCACQAFKAFEPGGIVPPSRLDAETFAEVTRELGEDPRLISDSANATWEPASINENLTIAITTDECVTLDGDPNLVLLSNRQVALICAVFGAIPNSNGSLTPFAEYADGFLAWLEQE